MIQFKKTELKNGIRVVSEFHSHSRAVTIGLWVLSGTRDENSNQAGISHFVEHLVFKGTKTKSAYQIAKSLEALGGELNAFTTREYTCYHATVLKEHWEKALEVLADLVSNMSITNEEFILEKSVIQQEITMTEDNPEEIIYDHYFERCFRGNPLGLPILGTMQSIQKMTQKDVFSYYKERYCGNNLIISASGCIDHQNVVEGTQKYLKQKTKRRLSLRRKKAIHKSFRFVAEKPIEQLHLLMGIPVSSFKDKYRFEAFIVNTLLGGGMTSKLYQSIREKKGLVYTLYSSLNTFVDCGLINIYAACEPKNMPAVLKNISAELRRIRKNGISESELNLFRTQVEGSLLLGADDIENRMHSIAVNEMVFSKYKPVEDIIEEMNQVTAKSVNEFIDRYIKSDDMGVILLGGGAKKLEKMVKEYKF